MIVEDFEYYDDYEHEENFEEDIDIPFPGQIKYIDGVKCEFTDEGVWVEV